MATPNQEYWTQRAEMLEQKVYSQMEKLNKELARQYAIAIDDILTQVQAFYQRYADENGLSYQQAQIQLNKVELQDYHLKIRQLRQQYQLTNNPVLLAEMERLQLKVKITRLEALLEQLLGRINLLTHEVETQVAEHLREVYQEGYYQTSYNLQVGLGVASLVPKLNEEAIIQIINYPWAGGEYFSERIWHNRDLLARHLRQILTQGLIQGQPVQKMAKLLRDKMASNRYYSERIVRTESNFFLNSATIKGYEANGVEYFEYLATLDKRTSQVCRKQDGKIIKVSEAKPGVNIPPLHPNCRSTITPYFKDINREVETRRAKLNSKSFLVSNMSYQEWFNKYVR